MSLESIFTSDQLDALIQAPLDVAVLAAEADFELEDIELQDGSRRWGNRRAIGDIIVGITESREKGSLYLAKSVKKKQSRKNAT